MTRFAFLALFSVLSAPFAGAQPLSPTPDVEPPKPECTSAFGRTVCGFDCVAAFGRIQCNERPHGACTAAFGRITCIEGPKRAPGAVPPPKAECKAAFGTTQCGYDCVAGFGRVQCNARPYGTCTAANGRITCVEGPPWSTSPDERHAAPPPKPECKSAYGRTVCGFDCMADYGSIRCNTRPGGTCTAANGRITCIEGPETTARPWFVASPPKPECKTAYGRTECGYDCVAAYGRLRCNTRPGGVCAAANGRITCLEGPETPGRGDDR